EIHPDYYQIPVADREALLREEEEAEAAHEKEADHAETAGADEGAGAPEVSEAAGGNAGNGENGDAEDGEDSNVEQAPANGEPVESMGSGDALEEMPERRRSSVSRRNYKIQEVIKRRQVMLVQVVKEERGNKGAALTTY